MVHNMRKRILFVDDEQRALDALRRMLRAQRGAWDLVCVDDPHEAWRRLQRTDVDVVVSDINMPGMTGLELLERVTKTPHLRSLPVVVLTGLDNRDLKRKALDLGAADLLNKPVEPEDLVARLRNVLRLKEYEDELKAYSSQLERRVEARTAELYRSRMDVIWRLGKAAEHRDNETGNHVIRVGCMARIIAEALGMEPDFTETLFVAAPLHDLGKIGIPDAILMKQGPLNGEEWEVMKRHCSIGARILQEDTRAKRAFDQWHNGGRSAGGRAPENPILQMAARVALMHHERWDGTGYPAGLAGEEIAVEARVVAMADVFDALTSARPYKGPYPMEKALRILRDSPGSHFDPRVHAAFEEALTEILAVRERFSDAGVRSTWEEALDEADSLCR